MANKKRFSREVKAKAIVMAKNNSLRDPPILYKLNAGFTSESGGDVDQRVNRELVELRGIEPLSRKAVPQVSTCLAPVDYLCLLRRHPGKPLKKRRQMSSASCQKRASSRYG